jgi:hypothetical protein
MEDFRKFVVNHGGKTIIILFILLSFKTCQSCNRGHTIDKMSKVNIHYVDSLERNISVLKDNIKDLSNDLKLAQSKEQEANKRADAIESTASKIRANTTIKVYTPEEKKDENKK